MYSDNTMAKLFRILIISAMLTSIMTTSPSRRGYFTPLKIDNHPCRAEILRVRRTVDRKVTLPIRY